MSATARRHFALVALAGVLWGTGGLAGAALIDATGASPTAVACYRLLGGGLLLALLVVVTPGGVARVPRTRAVGVRVVTTAVLIAAFEAAYFAGVARAGVALSTVVTLGAAPVMVAAASAVRSRRAPDRTTATALVLALVGLVALVGTSGSGASGGAAPALGVALSLVAAAAFAALTAVQTRPVRGLEPVPLIGAGFTLGGLLLVPAALVDGGLVLPHDGRGWALLAFLAAVPTAAAYAAYFTGLRTVPATAATLLALLEPLTAALGAVVVRHERLGPVALAGGALMLTAVVVLRPRGAPSPTMDAPGRAAGPEGHPDAVRAEGCDDVGSGA